MPMPKPNKDESHDDFMDRCMSDDVMVKEYPDNDQRYAVCESQWGGAKNNKSEDSRQIERRFLNFGDTELRIDDDKPKLTGYAAKYNKFTNILGLFKEKIHPDFFNNVLKDDVRCLKNHNPDLILGRTTNKTLRLKSDTVGLRYDNDLPDTNTGRDVREEVRTKLITGCSFAFTVAEDGEEWFYPADDIPERTLIKCDQLYDVGPVTYPAYSDTTVAARSLEKAKKEDGFLSVDEIREMDKTPAISKGETERGDKKYECECIECGHTLKTDKHCEDIKCPECGGTMRRKERPGAGQKSEELTKSDKLDKTEVSDSEPTFEQKFEYNKNVRKAERLRNRLNEKSK